MDGGLCPTTDTGSATTEGQQRVMLAGHCEAQEGRGPSPSMECRATGRLGSRCRDNTTGAVGGTWGHWEARSMLTTGMALLELQGGCWGRSG